MKIILNNIPVTLPLEIRTVEDLVNWKKLPEKTTAVAIDNRLINHKNWALRHLEEGESITIISAAFGG